MSGTELKATPEMRQLNVRQEEFFRTHGLGTLLLRPPERLVHPYAWAGHLPFAQTLVRIMKPRVVVELGTHTGNSFCSFCQAVKVDALDTRCYAIDTWRGDEHAGYYDDSVYDELASHTQAAFGGIAEMLRVTFDEAVEKFDDGSIDLLHIDGLHTYEAVRHDYETWKPKLSSHGVVLLHDTRVFEREFGVHKLWADLSQQYPGFEFLHSHGLGVLLIGRGVNPSLAEFISLAGEDPGPILSLFECASQVWLPSDALAYQRCFGTRHKAVSTDIKSLDCELYLDTGQGFSEAAKLISRINIEGKRVNIRYDLKRYSKGLIGLRFDPGSEPIVLYALHARARRPDGRWIELHPARDASIYRGPDVILFPADPWIEFSLGEEPFVSFELELEGVIAGTALTGVLISRLATLTELQSEMEEKEAAIQKLWDDLTAKDSLIRELQLQRERKDSLIGELQLQRERKDSLIRELQLQSEQKEDAARKLWGDLAAKDSLIEKFQEDMNRMRSHPLYTLMVKLKLIRETSATSEMH